MSNLPFVEEILADLRRFVECVEDGQDANLGRARFDLLTQLGLLERVQRSPALWMMTQAGEYAIAQPAAVERVNGYCLIRTEHLDAIKSKTSPVQVDCYLGRNLYDDDIVYDNWRACKLALDEIKEILYEIEIDTESDHAFDAMRAQGNGSSENA